jgi:hypothetical protein
MNCIFLQFSVKYFQTMADHEQLIIKNKTVDKRGGLLKVKEALELHNE